MSLPQRSKYDDGSGPVTGPEALDSVRATYYRLVAFIQDKHSPVINALRMAFYYVGKSLMVDEASASVQHVEAVFGKECAFISAAYEDYEFPSTHEALTKAASVDIVFFQCS